MLTTISSVASASPQWSSSASSAQLVRSPASEVVSIDSNYGIVTVADNAQPLTANFAIKAEGVQNYTGIQNATINIQVVVSTDATAPSAISNISIGTISTTSIVLSWIAPSAVAMTAAAPNQNVTWSDKGNEVDGCQWSCVQDSKGTADTSDDLCWEVKINNDTERDKDNVYRWGGLTAKTGGGGTYYNDWDALVNAANSGTGLCGFTDWRVPTVVELTLLIDETFRTSKPYIDMLYFSNTILLEYWLSTPDANIASGAWTVRFAFANSYSARARTFNNHVRLVR